MVATRRTSKISGNGSLSIVETRASKRTRHSLTPAPDSPVDVLVAPASEPTEEKKQIRTKQLRSSTVKKKKVVKQTAPILSLTDKLLLDIFTLIAVPENQQASQAYCREILPLVCKRWHHLLQLPSDVWKVITINFMEKSIDMKHLDKGSNPAMGTLSSQMKRVGIAPAAAAPSTSAPATDKERSKLPLKLCPKAIEQWLAPRAEAVTSLSLRGAASDPSHRFETDGSGITGLLALVKSNLQHLCINDCADIFNGASLKDLALVPNLRSLKIIRAACSFSEHQLESLQALQHLEELAITISRWHEIAQEPGLPGFPEVIFKLNGLTSLQLSSTAITRLPCGLARSLRNLETLDLSACNFSTAGILLRPLARLKSLKHLRMNEMPPIADVHTDIWYAVQALPHLESLEMRACGMKEIQRGLDQLSSLTSLDLSGNFMGGEYAWRGLTSLVKLKTLIAVNTATSIFPTALSELEDIAEIDFGHNPMVDITPEPGTLTKLTKINLSGGCFPCIPKCLSQLPALEECDLSRCIYLEVSRSLKDMALNGFPSLKRLDMRKILAPYQHSTRRWLEELQTLFEGNGEDDVLVWE